MIKSNITYKIYLFLLVIFSSVFIMFSKATITLATPPDLFISEYVEGASPDNTLSKALELYNGTGATIDLAAGQYIVEIYFIGTSTTVPQTTIALAGSVIDGDVFVLADEDSHTTILSAADQTSAETFYNGDDVVVLKRGGAGGTIVDVIGQLGPDPGTEWGTGDTSTADNTLRRQASTCGGDTNPDDTFDPVMEWIGYPADTFDGLGSHTANCDNITLVINEIDYDGTTTAEFIEIKNTSPFTVNLNPYDVILVDGVDSSIYQTIDLPFFNLAANDYYVICSSNIPNCDLDVSPDVDLIQNGAPDAIAIVQGTTIIDTVSYEGDVSGYTEGTGAGLVDDATPDKSIQRCGDGVDTNQNTVDFAHHYHTPGTVNTCVDDAPPSVADYASGTMLSTDNFSVTFSEAVTVTANSFIIDCTSSGIVAKTVSGSSIDPTPTLVAGETCTVTVVAAQVRDVDVIDPPDTMLTDFTFTRLVEELIVIGGCGTAFTPIYTLQENGTNYGSTGTFTVEGIVTGDFQSGDADLSGELGGFYLQDPDGDGDTTTSDGIFVDDPTLLLDVAVGQRVRVTGIVSEVFDQTQLVATTVEDCGTTGTITPVSISLPLSSISESELYEGMLITLPQTLNVTEVYNLGRFGEAWLSSGGRLMQPTNTTTPGAAANAVQAQNDLNRILLDDGLNTQNPDPTPYLFGEPTLRLDDTVAGLTGVLGYGFGAYRVRPTIAPSFARNNTRSAVPSSVGGTVRVASFNVLNYFNGDGLSGGFPTSRGADSLNEFNRQRDKIVSAILAMNADVIGLMEMENDGYGAQSAIQDLINGLNAASPAGTTYSFIRPYFELGTDAIKVALIYRVETVIPVGAAATTYDPPFDFRRPPLAQTFQQKTTNGRFTVVVNHFKSKSCSNADGMNADQNDGQGCWNAERTQAAQTLTVWLETHPTGSPDTDVLIIGDLNAYTMEDPVTTIQAAGYTNVITASGETNAYSYVFNGQSGTLDHALASTSLTTQVTGVTEWHINADEPRILDYNEEFKSVAQQALNTSTPYRASDHDPVIVGLSLQSDGPLPALPNNVSINLNQGRPTITWNDDPHASWYQVYVGNSTAGTLHFEWHEKTQGLCNGIICALTPDSNPLNGSYDIYIRAWGPNGFSAGGLDGWSGAISFTLAFAPPAQVSNLMASNVNSGRPTFEWTGVPGGTWYQIWVGSAGTLQTKHTQWILAADLGCENAGQCTLLPNVALGNGDYVWYVQTWGPGGYNDNTANPWVIGNTLAIDTVIPDQPVLGAPTGVINNPSPAFTWEHLPGVAYYQIWAGTTSLEQVHTGWYWSEDLSCTTSGICTLNVPGLSLASGNYVWYLQAYTPAGVGEWSEGRNFTVEN